MSVLFVKIWVLFFVSLFNLYTTLCTIFEMLQAKATFKEKENLIISINKFPAIWDLSCKSYHDTIAKKDCWKKVCEEWPKQ